MSTEPGDADTSRSARLLHLGGWLVSLLALAWIGWQVSTEAGPLLEAMTWRLAAALGVTAVAYACLGVILALAWWWLVRMHGDRPGWLPAVAVWSRSQFAKYLPTNVFHYVSRQILGRRLGLRHETLAASHVLESLSLFLAAGLLAGLSLWGGDGSTGFAGMQRSEGDAMRWLVLLAIAVLALVAWPLIDRLARRLPWIGPRLRQLPPLGWRQSLRTFGPVLALHALFFVGMAGLLHALGLSWHGVGLPWPQTVWVFALAWSLGTVTPGAPGGLGVREAALTLGLQELAGLPAGQAAGLALALRLATIAGDFLLYLAARRVPLPDRSPDDAVPA